MERQIGIFRFNPDEMFEKGLRQLLYLVICTLVSMMFNNNIAFFDNVVTNLIHYVLIGLTVIIAIQEIRRGWSMDSFPVGIWPELIYILTPVLCLLVIWIPFYVAYVALIIIAGLTAIEWRVHVIMTRP